MSFSPKMAPGVAFAVTSASDRVPPPGDLTGPTRKYYASVSLRDQGHLSCGTASEPVMLLTTEADRGWCMEKYQDVASVPKPPLGFLRDHDGFMMEEDAGQVRLSRKGGVAWEQLRPLAQPGSSRRSSSSSPAHDHSCDSVLFDYLHRHFPKNIDPIMYL